MRLIIALALFMVCAIFTQPVLAEDEFGARFAPENVPSALEDPEAALADIMPAAGDDEDDDQDDDETEDDDEDEEDDD